MILKPQDIYMVKVEGRDVRIYTQNQSYYAKKRLYEIKEQASFVQIAKGILINGEYLKCIETGLSGTMRIRLKNVLLSISMAMVLFCLIGMCIDLSQKGHMVFTHYTFTKMVIGAIMIGVGFGVLSLIYRVESVPDPIKVLIHMELV